MAKVNVENVLGRRSFFEVLQTVGGAQTATMRLKPGESSGPKSNEHPKSVQVLLVLSGEVVAEIGPGRRTLHRGDCVVVPAGVAHRFTNTGAKAALTFNVYAPPAYDPGEKQDEPEDEEG